MIILDLTEKLNLITAAAVAVDCYASWVDLVLLPASYTPDTAVQAVSTATSVTLVAAPAGTVRRQIKGISLRNRGTAAQTLTVAIEVSTVVYHLTPATVLQPGEVLAYVDAVGWSVMDSLGRLKTAPSDSVPLAAIAAPVLKIGTAPKAAGQWYSFSKDAGQPGAWSPGTPGLAGRITDGTSAADAGSIALRNAVVGSNYLTGLVLTASAVHLLALLDILWVNTGLVVTATTAQTIGSPQLPARDNDGSTDGSGVMIGLLCTATSTNALTTITVNYTNRMGVAGRTATGSLVAAATIGHILWFSLQAGDEGVRSIQSVTFAASLLTGSFSLVLARTISLVPATLANVGAAAVFGRGGVVLYPGVNLQIALLAASATAATVNGVLTVETR